MSETLIINGVEFEYPDLGDQGWGPDATDWAVAVTQGMLQKAGGSFPLTAEVDFGATFGLKTAYYKSQAANPSSAGVFRLGNNQSIGWRNAANDGNILVTLDSSDILQIPTDVVIAGDLSIGGALSFSSLALTGNFSVDGNTVLGSDDSDTLDVNADVISHLIPNAADTYDLGASSKEWRDVYAKRYRFDSQGSAPGSPAAGDLYENTSTGLNFYEGSLWKQVNRSIVNVKDYGATGDGSTDDTTAIQTALAAIPSEGAGIYFPAGEYLVSDFLVVPSNTKLFGDGPSSVIVVDGHLPSAQIGLLRMTAVENVEICSLKLLGTGTWTATPFPNPYGAGNRVGFTTGDYGITVSNSGATPYQNISVHHCHISGFDVGIQFIGGDVSSGFIVSDCVIENVGRAGIYVFNSDRFLITNNRIQNIQGNITDAGDTDPNNSSFADGVQILSSRDWVISNNIVYDFHRTGFVAQLAVIDTKVSRCEISNNTVHYGHDSRGGQPLTGIYVADDAGLFPYLISDNIIEDVNDASNNSGWGIIAQYAEVTGGLIKDCFRAGIDAYACKIDSVQIRDCTGRGIELIGDDGDISINNCEITGCAQGINVPANQTTAGGHYVIKSCKLYENSSAGILLNDASLGTFEIEGNFIADNGGDNTTVQSGIRITGYYDDQKVIIRNNTFVSSANNGATSGQLYAILGYTGGDFSYTTKFIEGNTFLFTGSLASYPTSLAVVPTSYAFFNGSTFDVYEIPNSFGNFNSKLPYGGIEAGGTAGFPRFLGYATAAPVSGSYQQGDFYINSDFDSGDAWSFVCVTAGTPGTWQSMSYLNGTTQSIAGAKTFTTQLIGAGTSTNDSAAAGYIGEYLESKATSAAVPTSSEYGDVGSLSLTAGDWDVSLNVIVVRNGATMTGNNFQIGIGTATGNNSAGLVNGDNTSQTNGIVPNNFSQCSLNVANYRVSIASTTTYYGKIIVVSYSAGSPLVHYRLSARRVR